MHKKRDLAISEAGHLFKHCWWIPQAAVVSISLSSAGGWQFTNWDNHMLSSIMASLT